MSAICASLSRRSFAKRCGPGWGSHGGIARVRGRFGDLIRVRLDGRVVEQAEGRAGDAQGIVRIVRDVLRVRRIRDRPMARRAVLNRIGAMFA